MKSFMRKWGVLPFLFFVLVCAQSVYSDIITETQENRNKSETYVLLVDLSSSAISGSEKLNRDFVALKKSFILSGVDSRKIVILGQSGSFPWAAPNRHNILNMLNSLCMAAGPMDTVVIFVSGKTSGRNCFDTQKVCSKTKQKQSVDAGDFLAALEVCVAKNRVLFLNASEHPEKYITPSSGYPFGSPVDDKSELLRRRGMITVVETPAQCDITPNMIRLAHMYVATSPYDASNRTMVTLRSRLAGIKPNIYLLCKPALSDSRCKVKKQAPVPPCPNRAVPAPAPVKRESPKNIAPVPAPVKKAVEPKKQNSFVVTEPVRHLLSLGISKYKDSAFPPMGGNEDCENVRQAFVNYSGVDILKSICLSDAFVSNYRLEDLICKYLPNRVKPGELLYIYLNGHFYFGDELTKNNDFLFLPYDAKFDAKGKGLLKMSVLTSWLKKYYDQSPVLLILDVGQTFDLSEKEKANILNAFAGFKNLSVIIPTTGKTISPKSKNSLLASILCNTLRNKKPQTVQEFYEGLNAEFKAQLEKVYQNKTDKLLLFNSGNEDLLIAPLKVK